MGNAKYVIIACDTAENTKRKIVTQCEYEDVPYTTFGDKTSLGECIGKKESVCVAVTDENFKNGLLKVLNANNAGGEGYVNKQ